METELVKSKRLYKPNPHKEIAKKIKAIRKALDLTQDEMGKESGYSQNGIASMETGVADPGFKFIRYLIVDKHVNSGYLFQNENTMFVSRTVINNVKVVDETLDLVKQLEAKLKKMKFTR